MKPSSFNFKKQKLVAGVALVAASLFISFILYSIGPVKPLSLRALDLAFRHLPLSPPHEDILIITIDQPDIDFFKEQGIFWPWPRQLYAGIIDFCRIGGASAILFDILFTEPSSYGFKDDEKLARSAAEFKHVTFPFFLSKETKEAEAQETDFLAKASLPMDPTAAGASSPYHSVVMPIQELVAASRALGNVSGDPDPDGTFRRLHPVIPFKDRWLPALSLSGFSQFRKESSWKLEESALVQGAYRIPLDSQGCCILNFRGPSRTYKRLSAANVIQSEIRRSQGVSPIYAPETVRGKWVFIGLTAPGLMDLKASPVGEIYPGVEIHATFLDNLLSGDFLKTASPAFSWLLTGITAVGVVASVLWASGFFITVAVPFLFMLGNIGVTVTAFPQSWWIDPILPVSTIVMTFFFTAAYSYATEGRQKKAIRSMFGHYLSESVISHLLVDPKRLQLGGERKRVTLFFSDLAGFTSLSERLEPEAVVSLLNQYLSVMTEIILQEAGTLDKFEGDAIMAFWGAPLIQPNQAVLACRAALRQQEAMRELNQRLSEQKLPTLRVRIGIHTGEAVVGNLGSERRFDFTVIGDTVNLASRLEGLNKYYGTGILVSEVTFQEYRNALEFMEIDRVAVKGRVTPITVFTPLSLKGELSESQAGLKGEFEKALSLYRLKKFEAAAAGFEAVVRKWPHVNTAKVMWERCRHLLEHPMPEDWDAVFRPDQK
ncbi:MAG: adenylate/guanylate cyclase domain-containing protein [Desulfobacterales bacterium CG07_land_8_20_14_0_80_52_14]|nr:MAG: adenylate/guanylate cyclase domain-containing protein [Desulfobacterales bacterium CG07_land_8_20_14_0_80_52_14]